MDIVGVERDLRRAAGRSGASSHSGSRANSQRSALAGAAIRAVEQRRPRPAQPGERLQRASTRLRARASPAAAQVASKASAACCSSAGTRIVARRLGQPQRVGQPLGRRHHEPRRVDEGEQFEQVEPRQVGIAQPRRHQRRVEQQQRRIRRRDDRLALGDPARRAVRRRAASSRHGWRGARGGAGRLPFTRDRTEMEQRASG